MSIARAIRRRLEKNRATSKQRAKLCADWGVPNTGRQWRRLRRHLTRAYRLAVAMRTKQ